MLKKLNETYPGSESSGYSFIQAAIIADRIWSKMKLINGIQDIIVDIKKLGNNKYRVINTSTYEI